MTTTVTPLFDALFIKLRAFLLTIVPGGTEVVKGYVNRVPQPTGNHIVITGLFERRLRTNVTSYDDDGSSGGTRNIEQGTECHVQFDYYGALAPEWCAMVSTLFRDEYAVNALAPDCSPLYIDDGRNMPLVTGEEQYLQRFCSTAVLQYNPVTTVPQQFADAADVVLVDAETLS
jgi:hypothetical protein